MTIRKKSAVKAYGGAVSRILFLVLTAALLGGCTPRNVTKGMAEGEAYDAVISVKGKQEEGAPEAEALDSDKVASEAETLDPDKADSEAETLDPDKTASDSGELLALAGLLGKTDDEAAEVFGGGEENRTEDGKQAGRSFGKNAGRNIGRDIGRDRRKRDRLRENIGLELGRNRDLPL